MVDNKKSPHIVGAKEGLITENSGNGITKNEKPTLLQSISTKYEPLKKRLEKDPYPIDALPMTIMNAVNEVRKFTQAPLPLIATAAINALSLAGQGQINVKRDNNLIGPVSLFTLIIADSGERKSTVDAYFTKVIRDFDIEQSQKYVLAMVEFKNNLKIWEAKEKGLLNSIKKITDAGKDASQVEANLSVLRKLRPISPKFSRILYTDATPEALGWNLANTWPVGGVILSEGGLFLGSHAMNNESVMRTFSLFNTMWDGGSFQSDRRKEDGSYVINNARLTVGLQVQEVTFTEFISRVGSLARGAGFFARFLFARPESTQGKRFYSSPPSEWPNLNIFNFIVKKIIECSLPVNINQILSPACVEMSSDAKQIWICFYNEVEKSLGDDGELYYVRDLASKAADNAARLAALFQYYEGTEQKNADSLHLITPDNMVRSCRLISWYLNEAVSILAEINNSDEIKNAEKLEKWLINRTVTTGKYWFSKTMLLRFGPNCLRKKEILESAIAELLDRNRLHQIEGLDEIYINPALIKEKIDSIREPATAISAIVANSASTNGEKHSLIAEIAEIAVAKDSTELLIDAVFNACEGLPIKAQDVIDKLLTVRDEKDIISGSIPLPYLRAHIVKWFFAGEPFVSGKDSQSL